MWRRRQALWCLALALVLVPAGECFAAKKKGKKGKAAKGKKADPGKKKADKKPEPVPPAADGPSIATAKPPVVDMWDDRDIEGKGRIVGRVTNCPGCKIELRDKLQKPLKVISLPRNDPDYLIEWVPAGTYSLYVTGGGYAVNVPNVTVEIKGDTHVDLAFPATPDPKGPKVKSTAPKIERWPTWRPTPEPKVPVPNFKPNTKGFVPLKDKTVRKGKKGRKR